MKICEIFYSISGEGKSVGYPTVFIRFAGCNLAELGSPCKWCDTEYSWSMDKGTEMSPKQVLEKIGKYWNCPVIITGGEPLHQKDELIKLCIALTRTSRTVEIETNGSLEPFYSLQEVTWTVDMKTPSSGNVRKNNLKILQSLRPVDQLKFVISDWSDFSWAINIIDNYNTKAPIVFSPNWNVMNKKQLVEWVMKQCPKARVSIQLHKILGAN